MKSTIVVHREVRFPHFRSFVETHTNGVHINMVKMVVVNGQHLCLGLMPPTIEVHRHIGVYVGKAYLTTCHVSRKLAYENIHMRVRKCISDQDSDHKAKPFMVPGIRMQNDLIDFSENSLELYRCVQLNDCLHEPDEALIVDVDIELTMPAVVDEVKDASWLRAVGHEDFSMVSREGHAVKVHRHLLAAHSRMFRELLFGAAPFADSQRDCVHVDLSTDDLTWLVDWMYRPRVVAQPFADKRAIAVLPLARYYVMDALTVPLTATILAQFDEPDCLELCLFAATHQLEELKFATATIIAQLGRDVSADPLWATLSEQHPDLANNIAFMRECHLSPH